MATVTVPRRELRTVTLHALGGIRDDVKEGFDASARSCRRSRERIREAMKSQSGDTVEVEESDLSNVVVECNIGLDGTESFYEYVHESKDYLAQVLRNTGWWAEA